MRPVLIAVLLVAGCTGADDEAEPVVPEVCLEALDHADDLNEISAEAFGVLSDVMFAAARFDTEAMETGNAAIDRLEPEVTQAVQAYREARDACRDHDG